MNKTAYFYRTYLFIYRFEPSTSKNIKPKISCPQWQGIYTIFSIQKGNTFPKWRPLCCLLSRYICVQIMIIDGSRWMEKAETLPYSVCCQDVGNKLWMSEGCAECSNFAIWQKVFMPLRIPAWSLKSWKDSSDTFRHVYFHPSWGTDSKSTVAGQTHRVTL